MTVSEVEIEPSPVLDYATPAPIHRVAMNYVKLRWRSWLAAILFSSIFGAIVSISLREGLILRQWAWDSTTDVRFVLSLKNAIDWGVYTNQVGLQDVYDLLVKKYGDEGDYRGPAPIQLDYPPLRLLIISNWTDWASHNWPWARTEAVHWVPAYKFNEPMLFSNVVGEIAGAIAMFLLVRLWVRRSGRQPPGLYTGYVPGLMAALLLWFNPAMIWNSHVFPQWDAWLLAPFLLAIYLALTNGWLVAGLIIGVGAMAKGQLLIITPVIMLWPIVSLRPVALLRMAIGFFIGVAAVASPWLINSWDAAYWVASVLAALLILLPMFFFRRRSTALTGYQAVAICIAGGLLMWPFIRHFDKVGIEWAGGLLVALSLGAIFLPHRAIAAWACGAVASAAMLCVPLFNGSMAWYTVGLVYGTHHWKTLAWRNPTTLGAILGAFYHWDWVETIDFGDLLPFLKHPELMPLWWRLIYAMFGVCLLIWSGTITLVLWRYRDKFGIGSAPARDQILNEPRRSRLESCRRYLRWPVAATAVPLILMLITHVPGWMWPPIEPMRYLMIAAFTLSLILCAIAIVVHVRRRDPRLLMAIVAPWVLMFALLPQMMPRYLVWGSAFAAGAAVLSLDGLLLYLIVTMICWANMFRDQVGEVLNGVPQPFWPANIGYWYKIVRPIYPGMGWGVLVLALIWLCLAIIPSRRRAPLESPA